MPTSRKRTKTKSQKNAARKQRQFRHSTRHALQMAVPAMDIAPLLAALLGGPSLRKPVRPRDAD